MGAIFDKQGLSHFWGIIKKYVSDGLDSKQPTLISSVNVKTINGESILGSGNITIKGGVVSSEVTATRADVLKGKTTIMHDSNDKVEQGTLEVQSIVNFNLSLYASETVLGAWQLPAKGLYSGVRVIYRTDRYPNNPNDGTVAYEGNATSFTKKLPPNIKHYFTAFSYVNSNIGRLYAEMTPRAEFTATTVKGRQVFKANGVFTVPTGVRNVQVFLVGGGGGGSTAYESQFGHGGGGGYTKTQSVSVTPNQKITVVVGAGGAQSANGGASKFGNVIVSGGQGAQKPWNYSDGRGKPGDGGSGGGRGSYASGNFKNGGNGGSDGADGTSGNPNYAGGIGQHSTTREFGQSGATLYSGGGAAAGAYDRDCGTPGAGGGGAVNIAGTNNTGGGGGSSRNKVTPGQPGGSGIVIVRWGY